MLRIDGSGFPKVARFIATWPWKSRQGHRMRDFWRLAAFRAFGEREICCNGTKPRLGRGLPAMIP